MRTRTILKTLLAMSLLATLVIVILNLMPERREVRDPIPHEFGVSDAQFRLTMNSVFGSDLKSGHQIETLLNGDEIFPPMLEAIGGATDTINFLTYIYWSGEIAEVFAEALAGKARDGVEVRVLIDWAGSIPFEQRLLDIMEEGGVVVHRFRPLHWYSLDRINNRTHRKLLIVDGKIGFTGGVGIGDQWRGNGRKPDEWRDNHYRVLSPAVSEMQAAFAENWLEATNEVLQGERFYPAQEEAGDMLAQHVKSSPIGGSRSMHQMILMGLAAAESHIRIAMAYYAPDDVIIGQLLDARARGVAIDVIVPGEIIDVPLLRRASRHLWGGALRAGIRIHEYQPSMYHTKMLIVDESWATIGSANFDERSFRLNDEANLNVYDRDFALEQIAIFNEDLTLSREVTLAQWEARSAFDKFLDWGASLLRAQL